MVIILDKCLFYYTYTVHITLYYWSDYDENDIIEMTALCEALANFGDKLELKDIQLIEKYIFKADITMEKDIKMQIAGNYKLL